VAHEDDQFSWSASGGVAVVHASGEVDLSTADRLRTCFQAALDASALEARPEVVPEVGPRVVVDLSETTFMDSSALGVLVGVAKQVDAQGGWLRVAAAQHPVVRRVFEITQLDVSLGDYPTVVEAIEG